MQRSALVTTLKQAEPGLSTKDLIPVLACFCFGDGVVIAYDDVVAIRMKSPIPQVEGGVRGHILLDFLQTSRADAVEITTTTQGSLEVKAASAKLELALTPKEDFVFEAPDTSTATELVLSDTILSAISQCLATMGMDPAHPSRLGVTLHFADERCIVFYSSNNYTATRVACVTDVPETFVGTQLIIPPRFCELLSASKSAPTRFQVTPDWIVVTFANGVELFSRTIADPDVPTFEKIFEDADAAFIAMGGQESPKLLERALERALVVLPGSIEKRTTFSVEKGLLRLMTTSSVGKAGDLLKFIGEHKPVRVVSSPDLLKNCLAGMTRIAFTEKCVILKADETTTRLIRVFEA